MGLVLEEGAMGGFERNLFEHRVLLKLCTTGGMNVKWVAEIEGEGPHIILVWCCIIHSHLCVLFLQMLSCLAWN